MFDHLKPDRGIHLAMLVRLGEVDHKLRLNISKRKSNHMHHTLIFKRNESWPMTEAQQFQLECDAVDALRGGGNSIG